MKSTLHYGKVKWSYEEDDASFPTKPTPLMTFCPIRIHGRPKRPQFSDKISLSLFKIKTPKKVPFKETYKEWYEKWNQDLELGEGRAFLRWVLKHQYSLQFEPTDYELHKYFTDAEAPRHDPQDEMSLGLSFAVKPVHVQNRHVKLYLQDDAVLNLISLPYGEECDFITLVQDYVKSRFLWENWRAPAPPFLDWVKAQAKRPVFKRGQLGFHPLVA